MKSFISILLLLLALGACPAGDINLNTLSVANGNGNAVFEFSISPDRLDRQPAWDPGKQPVPLPLDKALQIAQGWIGKQSWANQFTGFDKVTLDHQDACWYYNIDFDLKQDDEGVHPTSVMVLLDGSVVVPKKVAHPKGFGS